ncbi:MAG: TIGR02594 family protein [Gammaproteobacteria bacterium]|nr:TIGR02594 family protein [Gammaproteobacteria bacterium]
MKHIKLNDQGIEVSKIQILLNSKLTPSPSLGITGIFESKTQQAVMKFQKNQRLASNGIVEVRTRKALGLKPTATPIPQIVTAGAPWMKVAVAELGVHEDSLPGQHNKRIVEYHKTTTLKASDDETPWCSSFVNWVINQSGYKGTNSAAAKSWEKWGVSVTVPVNGSIVVIKKKTGSDQSTGSSSGYHVGFYISKTDKLIRILGGNQSNQVRYSNFRLSSYEVLAYRKPQ